MSKKSSIMWGILFILAALLIVFCQLGVLETAGLPAIIITMFLAPIIVINIIRLNFAGFLLPLAVIGILYARPLGIEKLVPWPILIVAVFLSIGLSFLFPRHGRHKSEEYSEVENIIDEQDGGDINVGVRFGASVKYMNTEELRKVNIDCSFGGLKIYFDHAEILGEQAIAEINMNFAGAELYIPKTWRIVNNLDCILGGVEEKSARADPAEKALILRGKLSFSGISIIYI